MWHYRAYEKILNSDQVGWVMIDDGIRVCLIVRQLAPTRLHADLMR